MSETTWKPILSRASCRLFKRTDTLWVLLSLGLFLGLFYLHEAYAFNMNTNTTPKGSSPQPPNNTSHKTQLKGTNTKHLRPSSICMQSGFSRERKLSELEV